MGLYLYEHPKTKKTIEIVQRMNEPHVYVDEKGVEWKRVFVNPEVGFDTKIDINSSKDFARKTANKKGSLGNLYDQAQEASHARTKQFGFDPVRKQYYKDWSKKRNGRKHPHDSD